MPDKYLHTQQDQAETIRTKAGDAQQTTPRPMVQAERCEPSGGVPGKPVDREGVADAQSSSALVLGRFRLEQELGKGAFGVVYRAHDPQLDRTIALKLPRFEYEVTPRQISRFMAEAKAAANLHHPNIVAVHDAGCIGTQYYIASSFVRGCTLRQMLKSQGRPSQRSAVKLLVCLADALAYAHAEGVVHRDIKPENILLSEVGEPYIADFGLARREASDVLQTREGTLLGTPAYMSPEQAEGKPGLVDARSDQWALGVIMYELLMGKRPFEGSELQLLYSIRHQELPSLTRLDRSISSDLDTICRKCLTKERDGRYANCGDLRDDLQRWLDDEAIKVRKPSWLERLRRWHRHNPALANLAVAFFLAVVLGCTAVTFQWYRAEVNRIQAEQNADDAIRARKIAEDSTRLIEEQKWLVEKTNTELNAKNLELTTAQATIGSQSKHLESKDAVIEQTSADKDLAQKNAEVELERRRLEERKNLDLRYLGEIHSAKMALDAGQALLCKSILNSTSPELRSIEHQVLGEMASYGLQYNLISDVRQLPEAKRNFFLGLHTPLTLNGVEDRGRLPGIPHVQSITDSGRYCLTAVGALNWLKSQLPPTYRTLGIRPNVGDPADRLPHLSMARVLDLRYDNTLFEIIAAQAWLSPSGQFLVTSRPTIDRTNPGRLQIGLEVVLREMQVSEEIVVEWENVLYRTSVGVLELLESPVPANDPWAPPASGPFVIHSWKSVSFSAWPSLAGAFSPDSQYFSAYDPQNGILQSWRIEQSQTVPVAESRITSLAKVSTKSNPVTYTASGNLLAAGLTAVEVLSPGAHAPLLKIDLEHPIDPEWDVSFSDSRKTLMACSAERMEFYALDTGSLTLSAQLPNLSTRDFHLNEQVRLKAASVGIPIVDWQSSRVAEAPDLSWYCVKISEARTVEYQNVQDRRLLLFERSQNIANSTQAIWKSHSDVNLSSLAVSADNRWCVLWSDRRIFCIDLSNLPVARPRFSMEPPNGPIRAVDISPAAAQIAVCIGDRVQILSLSDGVEIGKLALAGAAAVQFSTDGHSLLLCDNGGVTRVVRIDSGQKTREWSSVRNGAAHMATDRLEQWLVTGGQEQVIRRWRFLDGVPSGSQNIEAPVVEFKLLESQELLLARLADHSAIVFKWPTLERVARVHSQRVPLLDILPTNDSKRMLVARADGVAILDVKFGTKILDISSFENDLLAARFSQEGDRVFCLSEDGQLGLIDITKSKLDLRIRK